MNRLAQAKVWAERSRARFAGVMLALLGVGLQPLAVFGQPLDSVFGVFGLILLIGGIAFAAWGTFTVMTARGKGRLMGGVIGLVIGAIVIAMFGVPALPSATLGTTPPSTGGTWQVCLVNVNGPTLGAGTCPTSATGILTTKLGQPGTFTAGGVSGTTNKFAYWAFNVTVTPPSGSTQVSYNIVAAVVTPVQSVSNTSNSANFGPSLATRTSGAYDVGMTPNGGTQTFQTSTFGGTPGTQRTLAVVAQFGSALTELAVAQYPTSVSFSISFSDQTSGAVLGTLTFSCTVQHN